MILCYVLIGSLFFLSGVWQGNSWKRERMVLVEESKKVEKEIGEERKLEKRWDLAYERGKEEKISELSEEEKEFLKEYLYGTWYFSDCIMELSETKENGAESNFSYIGKEMIKFYMSIEFKENSVEISAVSLNGNKFCNTKDPYLFAIYGGISLPNEKFQLGYDVNYSIEKMETGQIQLDHVFYPDGYEEVEVEWMKDWIHVTYYPVDALEESRLVRHIIANDIYIDPNNEETMYIDFCGLWKMKKWSISWENRR